MAKQLKIGVISIMEGYPWGGSEELWYDMAIEALNAKQEVLVSYKSWDTIPKPLCILRSRGAKLFLRNSKTYYPSIAARIFGKIIGKPAKPEIKNIFEEVFKKQPDLILINEGAFLSILHFPELYELLLKKDIPYILLSHQNREYGAIKPEWYLTAQKIYCNAEKALFVSERNRTMANYQLCKRLNNSLVVRNPVNLEDPEILPFPKKERINLACVGRLHCEQKGQDLLLRALAKLYLNYDFQLSFYGSGPDEKYLQDLTIFLELEDNVKFCGFVENVGKVWEENQMLILASHYEGMPLVVVEAMLCGRPCLVTDVAGHTEWIEDGINGYICESPTVNALKSKLINAFLNHTNWEQMGIKARERALSLHDSNPGRTLLNLVLEGKND